ncbi:COP9 signalosome [Mycena pura]|uniref:COP9 signalosome n=1 Tax=Mycena pura TaxID=153505 RepID=A0AAD6VUV5_9AGAR|nr:COP9 signalosome [Mycena pura]
MATASPPTPPPTSATEIQDATRTVVPPLPTSGSVSAPSPTPQGGHDPYTQIFPQLSSLASEKNFTGLIRMAEAHDSAYADRQPTRLLLTAPLVLAYLIVDDLPPARFALIRLPNDLTSSTLGKHLGSLLASTSERKYANVYARSQALLELVRKPDFPDASLGALLSLMVGIFLEAFRDRTFNLLQKAYASLPLPLAQTYLGLPAEDVLSAAASGGWTFDASTQVLSPAPKSGAHRTTNSFSPFSSLATFDFVVNSVAKLET